MAMMLGPHANKILACYVEKVAKDGFKLRPHADLKAGDHDRLLTAIPEPFVLGKAYGLSKFTKHKHPAPPTGLDEDEMLSHKIPAEALNVHAQLVQLPATECSKRLFDHTTPHETPTELQA
jgi:hypothetical protein